MISRVSAKCHTVAENEPEVLFLLADPSSPLADGTAQRLEDRALLCLNYLQRSGIFLVDHHGVRLTRSAMMTNMGGSQRSRLGSKRKSLSFRSPRCPISPVATLSSWFGPCPQKTALGRREEGQGEDTRSQHNGQSKSNKAYLGLFADLVADGACLACLTCEARNHHLQTNLGP